MLNPIDILRDPLRNFVNPTMSALLRSRWHRMMSGNILLLTFTGRKTGARFTTPLSYSRQGDRVSCFTDARWSNNLRGGAPVRVRMAGVEYDGVGEQIVGEVERIAQALTAFLRRVPRDAKFYGLRLDRNGEPDAAEVRRVARYIIFLEIRLSGSEAGAAG